MSAKAMRKGFDEKALNESFEHARELKFEEDFEATPSKESEVSKTANLFGDFYFTKETHGAKALASKVVNKELQEMRDRLQWGTLAPSKPVPKEEFQAQLSKSRFLSLFLVMRRVTGKFQFAQKKKAFKHWVEWLRNFLLLYRSRQHLHATRGRSASPNSRSVKFQASETGSVYSASTHSHPHNYHFHGDKRASPEQIRRELYLHRDVFLTSSDADAEQALLHHLHPHAANHPEREFRTAAPKDGAHRKPDIKHAHALVPSHVVYKNHGASDSASRRSASPGSTVITSASTASRQRVSNLSPSQLKKELYLHHDMFLTSQDDIADAVLHRAHPHAANHPEMEFKAYDGQQVHHSPHGPSVPSHIVPKHGAAGAGRSRSLSPQRGSTQPASTPGKSPASGSAAHPHGERSLSPERLKKELYLHHDMFLTSEDDIADAVLHCAHPHSPHHPELAAVSRFMSPKRRASMRMEAEKKAQATVPSHVVPKHSPGSPQTSRPSSPGRSSSPTQPGKEGYHFHGERNMSPTQLKKELYLHHDMFLTSQDDVADAVLHRARPQSPIKAAISGAGFKVSCRGMDTLAGSRKDAHALHKGDPVAHVKAIAAGKHPSNIVAKPIAPSLYSSGAAPTGLRGFNHTNDKKHAPKPRMSHSPTRHLPEEHAVKVGIQIDPQELRPGTPSRTLARALSILVTPASDAIKHDHRVKPEHALRRTLSALAVTGHDDIVDAVVPSPEPVPDTAKKGDSDESDYDDDSSDGEESDDPAQASRLGGLDLTKGLSIRTGASVDGGASVTSSSTSPMRRRSSFQAPTVSHILKLAHRSDSVEKVASKVAKKRSTVKQTLPKSPHPTQTFPIIPEELVAKRAERRTSFRSPTKSHAIKVAAKLGGGDTGSVISSSPGGSPDSPARRKSFADSLPDRDRGDSDGAMFSIRTFIPFSSGMYSIASVSPASSFSKDRLGASNGSVNGAAAGNKLVRRGSTVSSHVKPAVSTEGGTPAKSQSSGTGAPASSAGKGKGGGAVTFNAASVDDGDDASSIAVYNVTDDLDNLFDATSPTARKTKATPKAGESAATGAAPAATVYPKYKPGTPKHKAQMKRIADERNSGALAVIFRVLDGYHGKVGKTTTTRSAFAAWKAATGWFRKLEERVPQSIMYLLQVEKVNRTSHASDHGVFSVTHLSVLCTSNVQEVLWRVFCVYCPEKHRIPFSPPNLAVAPVLSPEAVERLASGYSAHHDHHAHEAAVLHPYHDIHDHSNRAQHKDPSQAAVRRDLYLHHDVFLNTTNDEDVAEALLLKAHRHSMNHPEEGIVVHHEHVAHVAAPVVHHHDAVHAQPHQHEVNKKALHRDLHLHHDVFLSSEDGDLEELAITHSHPHAANHPEEGVIVGKDGIKRPAPIVTSPHPPKSPHSAPVASMTPSPVPSTPLYGLFTVIEDDEEHGSGHSPAVSKLDYGSPDKESQPAEPHGRVPKSMELQISHPHAPAAPAVDQSLHETAALRASTRFRKHLLDLDGLWHLFQDFNVVPYLFW
jgi:hypothetical protein